MNFTNLLKKNIVPLIFVFLFSTTKAESFDSAFVSCKYNYVADSSLVVKKLCLSKKLFQNREYSNSLKYCYQILKNTSDPLLLSEINLLIGNIFKATGYPEKANEHYINTLKLTEGQVLDGKEKKYEEIKSEAYLRLGAVKFSAYKDIDSALYYYDKLIKVNFHNDKIIKFKTQAYGSMSGVYAYPSRYRDIKKAKKYAFEAINSYNELEDSVTLSAVYGNLGNIYAEEHNHEEARLYYEKAIILLEKRVSSESVKYLEAVYYNLAWSLYNLKNYRGYDYLYKSIELKDSLKQIEHKKELKKIDLKYNIDKIRQEEENKRLQAERKSWVIGVIGVVVSLLFLYLANLYKLRQRNLSLKLSKSKLEQQRKLDELKSESQVKIINATLDGKETERKQIAETLHDNVSALLSSANMHLQATEKKFEGELPLELQKTQQIILEASQKIRDLSHHLVSSILLKFGLEYAVNDVAKKYSNSEIKIHVIASNLHRYSQESEIKIFNIIQELINNVLKHSRAKNAYVMLEESMGVLSIIVKDDGLGFDKKKIEDGIGLNQIQARIYMMEGDFDIKTSKEGTKILINIPVKQRDEINFV